MKTIIYTSKLILIRLLIRKGNYKTDSERMKNKLESIDFELTGEGESITKLK